MENIPESLVQRCREAQLMMRFPIFYQKIIWGMSPLNRFDLVQSEDTLSYVTDRTGYKVLAEPRILGTHNLDDQTFLWADKNPSISPGLSSEVWDFRKTLPEIFSADKFLSTPKFNRDLVALFGQQLQANAFDILRKDRVILYCVLLGIQVFKGEKLLYQIPSEPHVRLLEKPSLLSIIKEYHKERYEVNRKRNDHEIGIDEAFDQIQEVHNRYWNNDDPYHSPGLSWPCDFAPDVTGDWQVFELLKEKRLFVTYSSDVGWKTQFFAYEIDPLADGKKCIINEF